MFNMNIRNRHLLLLDMLVNCFSYSFIVLLLFPTIHFNDYFVGGISWIIISICIYSLTLFFAGTYRVDWVVAGTLDYVKLLSALMIAMILSIAAGRGLHFNPYSLKMNGAVNLIAVSLICALRFFVRLTHNFTFHYGKSKGKRTLIIGAGSLGVTLIRDICRNANLNYNVVGLIDDSPSRKNQMVHGVKVLGNRYDIPRICNEKRIEEIIFAIHTIDKSEKSEILNICSKTGRKVKVLTGLEEMLSGTSVSKIREVEIEDLLERDPIVLDDELIAADIKDKVIMVTGGGGSIGSELCRQILRYKPKKLIILDIYENTTYELQNELSEKYPNQDLEVLIASVRDKERLNSIFDKYTPDIVFHAAAHKHVPLMEYSPMEAIKNNVFGTYNVAMCAKEHKVRRFVLISTDKAVNPTNVMGATKRMCEMIVQTLQKEGETDFVAVRFGNVLGSNGSVIPRFRKQISEGGPVTVTHPEITRFFMTIPEAAQLVLQAASYAKGGEIFVLDMGQPVKIIDLARKMIRLSGFKPEVDIKIEFTGLRAGEKLYEELLMSEEGLTETSHRKIFVGKPIDITYSELEQKLVKLEDAMHKDNQAVKQILSEVVPTYIYKNNA